MDRNFNILAAAIANRAINFLDGDALGTQMIDLPNVVSRHAMLTRKEFRKT